MVYAGMGPDYRVLVTEARKAASVYSAKYGEPIPTEQLVMNLATVMQVRFIIIFSMYSFFVNYQGHHIIHNIVSPQTKRPVVLPDIYEFYLQ